MVGIYYHHSGSRFVPKNARSSFLAYNNNNNNNNNNHNNNNNNNNNNKYNTGSYLVPENASILLPGI